MEEEEPKMRTRIGVSAMLLGVVSALGFAVAGAPQTSAPHDPQVIDAQGYVKIVQQHRGKPLLMTFWATWCEPCRDEYPMLNELAKQYAPQGLKVVGVNMDQDGDLILMRRFIARYKPMFPNYRRTQTETEETFRLAVLPGWTGSLPISIFYGKDGRKVENFVGEKNREAYEGVIRSLLNSGSNK
jgi:thiol-disulfide isomerase/thioredoxin